MGLFDKVMFWKKKDDFGDLGLDSGLGEGGSGHDLAMPPDMGMQKDPMLPGDLGLPKDESMPSDNGPDQGFGMEHANPGSPMPSGTDYNQPGLSSPAQPTFGPQSGPPPQQHPGIGDYTVSKDIEVISSKLDALRASLDSINQRLANLERIAQGDQDQRKYRGW